MTEGAEICRQIMQHASIRDQITGELSPGDKSVGDMLNDEVRKRAFTVYHPVGTCRMGSDDRAVVGPDLRVRGIRGLRVADASIMPSITGGNTNAPSMMIGEACAALMR